MAKFAGCRKICWVSQESPWASAGSSSWQSHSGDSPSSQSSPSRGKGELGGAQLLLLPGQQLCLCPPASLGLLLPLPFAHHFLGNSQLFSGFWWWKMETPRDCESRSWGCVRPFWALQRLCLSLQSWLTKALPTEL